ncbi:hypothetical protein E2C01_051563 [Portunus trituberculatus]|uniref:Uncharacterized protein n=1 Tax=Portunus trituberculatus TaxID=210409 RepID=A0A5B7GBC0_PORTR|nr:hypothetical protein [Portunus trituberculatus]
MDIVQRIPCPTVLYPTTARLAQHSHPVPSISCSVSPTPCSTTSLSLLHSVHTRHCISRSLQRPCYCTPKTLPDLPPAQILLQASTALPLSCSSLANSTRHL